jgi:hypothetical protein
MAKSRNSEIILMQMFLKSGQEKNGEVAVLQAAASDWIRMADLQKFPADRKAVYTECNLFDQSNWSGWRVACEWQSWSWDFVMLENLTCFGTYLFLASFSCWTRRKAGCIHVASARINRTESSRIGLVCQFCSRQLSLHRMNPVEAKRRFSTPVDVSPDESGRSERKLLLPLTACPESIRTEADRYLSLFLQMDLWGTERFWSLAYVTRRVR